MKNEEISILVGFDGGKDYWFVELNNKEVFRSLEYEDSLYYSKGLFYAYNDCGVRVVYQNSGEEC